MSYGQIRVGNGTHTGTMLGYCSDCGLYHGSEPARAACAEFIAAAADTEAELAAWRTLRDAVALEATQPLIERVGVVLNA